MSEFKIESATESQTKTDKKNHHKAFYENRDPLDISFYRGNYYNNYRRSRAILILSCLETHSVFKALKYENKMRILRRIERSIYNKTCKFIQKQGQSLNWQNDQFVNYYNITAFNIQANLEFDPKQNTDLIQDLCANDKKANEVGFMTSRQLHPEVSSDIHKIIDKRMKQKIKKKISTQHQCYSCGNWRTTEHEMQARSLDEGSTLIIICETEGCSNKWTLSS